jgi:hypothetical protein
MLVWIRKSRESEIVSVVVAKLVLLLDTYVD